MGGLGIRKTTELSLAAFLSSVASTEQGVKDLLGQPSDVNQSSVSNFVLDDSQDVGLSQHDLINGFSAQNFNHTVHTDTNNTMYVNPFFEEAKDRWKTKVDTNT